MGRRVWRWLNEHALADLVTEVSDRFVCFCGDFAATLREMDAIAAHWEEGQI